MNASSELKAGWTLANKVVSTQSGGYGDRLDADYASHYVLSCANNRKPISRAFCGSASPRIRVSSISAARRPMRKRGETIVVNLGVT